MFDISEPADVAQALRASHHELLMAESQSEVETLRNRLANLPVGPGEQQRERIGDAVLRALRADRHHGVTGPIGDVRGSALAHCRTLDRPVFSIESPPADSPTIFSRAGAGAGTLEVRARVGVLNGIQYPSSDAFLMAFNRATASIGAAVPIPPHASGPTLAPATVLDVRVELRIENIWSHADPVLGSGKDLIWTVPGDGDLPLRGNAVAWCRAGLTLVGAGGSASRTSVEFVSGWVNRDGMDLDDRASNGLVTLSHTAVISNELVVAGVFLDVTCFAAAEESSSNGDHSAYAELKCTSGDGWPVPSHLRLDPESIRVRLCDMPFINK